ncbi:MAG TPA: dTDP-4-dehydrorhamnose reductase [Candidatus Scybalomonas excrementigallinarum]|nr:dTDP-4-dehydrorhamnose reductase [Candidatus Scybalomonas excrementigallinarum]
MKFLVTGVNGQLGYDIVKELEKRGHEAVGTDRSTMDITNQAQVEEVVKREKVDGIFHCAAYTAVDKAEDEIEQCRAVNATATAFLAKVCQELGIKMLYLSTDYVFDGEGTKPWDTEDKVIAPLNIYGQTKYEGEEAVKKYLEQYFIVRISWVFGKNGNNFIKTMLRLGKERGAVSVVQDQVGSPTYTADLAVLLVDMMETEKYGIYHATNEGFCSWYEFACEIFKQAGMDVVVTPVDSTQFKTKAKRPHNSRMKKEKLIENGFHRLPSWQDALSRYLKEIMEETKGKGYRKR